MPDYLNVQAPPVMNQGQGLLMGISEGLKSGLLSYQQAKQYSDHKKEKETQLAILAQKQGMLYDPDTGNVSKDPQAQAKGLLPSSTATGALHKLYPELKDTDFTGMSEPAIGNVFKVQRMREGIKARERMEQERFKHSGDLKSGNYLNPRGTGMAGRDPQEAQGLLNWDRKAVERYQKQLWSSTKGLKDVASSADTIDKFTEMAKTNPATAAALPVLLARAIGEKGPLSNFDVKMWGGSKAAVARLERAAQMMYDGTLPEGDVGFIKEVALTLGNAAKQRLDRTEQDVVEKFSSNYGGDPEGNYKLIVGRNKTVSPDSGGQKPKKFYSPSRNKTKIVYPDGREEIVDGKQ